MRVVKNSVVVAAVCASVLWNGLALSQPPAGSQPPAPGQPNVTDPPATLIQLDEKNFPEMLQQFGYKVEAKQTKDNEAYWVVQTQSEGWGFVVEVLPQRNKASKKISGFWLISDLGGTINNPAGLSPAALLKLMEKSHDMAPFFFTYNSGTKHIAMNYEYPYGTTDAKGLKTQFDTMFGKIRASYDLWKGEALVAGAAKPNPVIPNSNANLAGSSWQGSETLQGYGKLSFQFAPGGKATMYDNDGATPGKWSQSGNLVTVSFHNGAVSYKGAINGNAMTGSGHNGQQTWTFTLTRQK